MNVFTYGTLMFPEVFEAVTASRLPSVEATLPGYRREAVRGAPYPGIRRHPHEHVEGRLYRGVGRRALRFLDAFEGPLYARVLRRVRSPGNGPSVRAWCYPVSVRSLGALTGEPWVAEDFGAATLEAYRRRCRRMHARFRRGRLDPGVRRA